MCMHLCRKYYSCPYTIHNIYTYVTDRIAKLNVAIYVDLEGKVILTVRVYAMLIQAINRSWDFNKEGYDTGNSLV